MLKAAQSQVINKVQGGPTKVKPTYNFPHATIKVKTRQRIASYVAVDSMLGHWWRHLGDPTKRPKMFVSDQGHREFPGI